VVNAIGCIWVVPDSSLAFWTHERLAAVVEDNRFVIARRQFIAVETTAGFFQADAQQVVP
jgi:hypothetical protein